MKRHVSVERALNLRLWQPPFFIPAQIVPPRSIVRLVHDLPQGAADLKVGDEFRVGYYSRQDGANCVWLVASNGKYEQTWDQGSLLNHFELIFRTGETDIHGRHRRQIEVAT